MSSVTRRSRGRSTRGREVSSTTTDAPRSTALAGAQERPRNVITWQPLSLITGYVDLEYERAIGTRFSVYAAPGAVFSRKRYLNGTTSLGVFGASLDVGARWFPLRDAPSGLFVDLGFGVFSSAFASLGDRVQGFGVRGMLVGGYTLILLRHIVLSGGLGVQVSSFDREYHSPDVNVYPVLRVAVGASF